MARKCGNLRPASSAASAEPVAAAGAVGVTAGTAEVVIATKLFRPNPRHQTVERVRLHDLLRHGCMLPLTLVVAPAGWGKSTLVAGTRPDHCGLGFA